MQQSKPLESIGFYTLSDHRAKQISPTSPMWRCELIITGRCNFKCPYCRGPEIIKTNAYGDMPPNIAMEVLQTWTNDDLQNIRFSGGEPTLHRDLAFFASYCQYRGVKRIAVSSNGSRPRKIYEGLLKAGINDFSISLDACCASAGDQMAGVSNKWEKVVDNIRFLAKETYVSVGVVLTEENLEETVKIINFAHELGVQDVRIIPSAQENKDPKALEFVSKEIRDAHPILDYRIENFLTQRRVRGISDPEHKRCYLVLDDSAIAGQHHFPCIIYMREGGMPIGKIGPNMRAERVEWSKRHNVYKDPICQSNCLDVCVDFNDKVKLLRGQNAYENL